MYFKLAFRNVRKSIKDYLLYFLTLGFGVCIFYVFNSLDAQDAALQISGSEKAMLQMITVIIGYISIFVSVVLGFLIVGANHFLIRRRKQEMGIYLLLGMKKSRLSIMLVIETLIIGFIALASGLLLGIFLSQWMSLLTANIFSVDMKEYTFIFSQGAFIKTLIYFGVIFLVVIVASTISISKNKLIDLFSAQKQNQKSAVRHPLLTAILFVLSVICLGVAYQQVLKNGMQNLDANFRNELILGVLGTFLFFASLSGFFLKVLQRFKKFYYKGLNFFILRQINSRINSVHLSLSLVCLMLFLTIAILSTGLGLNAVMTKELDRQTSFDMAILSNSVAGANDDSIDLQTSIADILKEKGIDLQKYTKEPFEFKVYGQSSLLRNLVLTDEFYQANRNENVFYGLTEPMSIITLSDYNQLLRMRGMSEISLADGQVGIAYPGVDLSLAQQLEKYMNQTGSLELMGQKYSVYPQILTETVIAAGVSNNQPCLIVPDEFVLDSQGNMRSDFFIYQRLMQFNCFGDSKTKQEELFNLINGDGSGYNPDDATLQAPALWAISRSMMESNMAGTQAILAFVGIYLGLTFLIASSAILALQQLSEVADNRRRYLVLKKIGTDSRLIDLALLKQTAIYFMLPLALAIVHSIVAIIVLSNTIQTSGGMKVGANVFITAIVIILVYGVYFLATFLASRRMIVRTEQGDSE